jgi:hypothetical protein
MAERQGVEIDYCPQCRGVWLDRGELDKIIERSSSETAPGDERKTLVQPQESYRAPKEEYRGSGKHDEYSDDHDGYKKRKKGGLLGEIFDF